MALHKSTLGTKRWKRDNGRGRTEGAGAPPQVLFHGAFIDIDGGHKVALGTKTTSPLKRDDNMAAQGDYDRFNLPAALQEANRPYTSQPGGKRETSAAPDVPSQGI